MFILGVCKCGCNEQIKINSSGYLRKFKNGHNVRGKRSGNYQKGWYIHNKYKFVLDPDYPNQGKYIQEHRLVMQKKLGRKLKGREEVHHIDGNTLNNSPENLELFDNHSEHITFENQIDMSGRICLICKSPNTFIDKRDGRPDWFKHEDGFICKKCYDAKRWRSNIIAK